MDSTADIVLAAQWGALRGWVENISADDRRCESVLAGWTVDDLLSHLARTVDAIAALRPVSSGELAQAAHRVADGAQAQDDDTLLTIAGYLSGYGVRAGHISEVTKKAAASSRADRVGELDAAYSQAQRTLAALGIGDPLVRVTGGIMALSDFLETRIIELVTHADDLRRSLPDVMPAPLVLPAAVSRAEATLRAVLLEVAGVLSEEPEIVSMSTAEFIAVATGRSAPDDGLSADVKSVFPLF